MPVIYSISPADKVIRTACLSPLTFAEVIEHFRTLQQDPACSGSLDVLLDVSDADLLPESAQLGAIKTELSAIRDKVQFRMCAIVATRDAMFGMMRMFEVLVGPYFVAIRVFRGIPEAEAWLVSQKTAEQPGW
jgi:hypothetical protein